MEWTGGCLCGDIRYRVTKILNLWNIAIAVCAGDSLAQHSPQAFFLR